MKISIITVCYNAEKTIADTLSSVKHQTYPDVEHIVVDGNSIDNTLKIIHANKDRITNLISEPDNGIYDAMNKGIRAATGDIIGFLNSDDVFAHNNVLAQIANALSDPSVKCCYGDLVYVSQNNMNHIVRYWKSREYKKGLFRRGWMPAHPTFYAKREIYEKYGLFDLRFRQAADFELLLRFMETQEATSKYIPEIMIRMRLGGVSNASMKNVYRQNVEVSSALKKHGYHVGLISLFFHKIFSKIPQFFFRPTT